MENWKAVSVAFIAPSSSTSSSSTTHPKEILYMLKGFCAYLVVFMLKVVS